MKDNKESARTMLCEFCRGFFPLSEIRYVPKGNSKIALCEECRARDKKEGAKKKVKEEIKEEYIIKESKTDKIKKDSYFCRRCKYKFKFAPVNDTNLKCPYCGRIDSVVER